MFSKFQGKVGYQDVSKTSWYPEEFTEGNKN